jgi:hypothetical protein
MPTLCRHINSERGGSIAREQQHWQTWAKYSGSSGQRQAIHARHRHIGDQKLRPGAGFDHLDRGIAIRGRQDSVPALDQGFAG